MMMMNQMGDNKDALPPLNPMMSMQQQMMMNPMMMNPMMMEQPNPVLVQ